MTEFAICPFSKDCSQADTLDGPTGCYHRDKHIHMESCDDIDAGTCPRCIKYSKFEFLTKDEMKI